MALNDTIAAAVATAKSATSALQDDITIEPWTGNSRTGAPAFGSAVTVPALIEFKQEMKKDRTGRDVITRAKVTILQPITANGTSGRHEPVDPRDRLTLPDGTVGPILSTEGLINPSTNAPYYFEIYLGGTAIG